MSFRPESLHIWTDPASKISFLETLLHGQDWRADIHFPKEDTARLAQLGSIRDTLIAKGYQTSTQTDKDGHTILRIAHEHNPQDLPTVFKKYGLVTGTAHTINKPIIAATDLIKDTANAAHRAVEYFKDPARANGFFFLLSETFITLGNTTAKYGSAIHPKNLALSLAGALWMGQSLAYTFVAKKGDERITDSLFGEFDKANKADSFLPNLKGAKVLGSEPATGIGGKAVEWVQEHPIQFGAICNNLGMLSFLAHALLERRFRMGIKAAGVGQVFEGVAVTAKDIASCDRYLGVGNAFYKGGFAAAVGGAMTSLVAWTLMLLPQKEPTGVQADTLIGKIKQTIDEHPEKISSMLAFASSSQRLYSGWNAENKMHTIGEALYIPGDLLLWFTKNTEYGGSRRGGHDGLVKAVAAHINALPLVMSPERQTQFVTDLSDYLAVQSVALAGKKGEAPDIEKVKAEAEQIRSALGSAVDNQSVKRFDLLVGAANRLVERFDESQRAAAADALAAVIPALSGVEASVATLKRLMVRPTGGEREGTQADVTTMHQLVREVKEMVSLIPGARAGDNAAKIYDALLPVLAVPSKGNALTPSNKIMNQPDIMAGRVAANAPEAASALS